MRKLRINTDVPSSIQTVKIGTGRYRIRLDWMERAAGWYVSVSTASGDALATGKRLVPNWSPAASLVNDNGVVLLCVDLVGGRDTFSRHDLGDTVLLVVGEATELTEAAVDPNEWEIA